MVLFLSILLVAALLLLILSVLGYAHNKRIWDIQIAFGSLSALNEKKAANKFVRRLFLGTLALTGLLIYFW